MPRDKNIFTLNPTSLDMPRSVFPIKTQHKTSFNLGSIVPIYFKDILPGDTITMDMAHVIRTSSALVAPMMDNIYADVYFFFVPYRLVWEHWEQFCGANDTGAWTQSNEYVIPSTIVKSSDLTPGTIGNYFGLPCISASAGKAINMKVSELPLRAYAAIFNSWFRDENSIDPILYTIGDNPNSSSVIKYNDLCFKASRFHDLFSSCLPAPQKGASIQLPLGTEANIGAEFISDFDRPVSPSNISDIRFVTDNTKVYHEGDKLSDSYATITEDGGDGPTTGSVRLFADLSEATAATVNQVRMAFQLQKLLERDARGGTRYQELLMSHFRTRGADARLQRPEYICGKRFPISIDQVVSHAETIDSSDDTLNPVGQVAAMSKTTGANSLFTKSFVEHGMLIGLIVLRQDHTYSEGLDKYWSKSKRFDFYYPVLANLGEMPVYKSELSVRALEQGSAVTTALDPESSGVFGYQEAWYEYRYQPSRATGYMNPSTPNSLSEWTLGDVYSSVPALNQAFLEETPDFLDRVLTTQSANMHQFIADFYFKGKQARVMPVYSIPGLIDHH